MEGETLSPSAALLLIPTDAKATDGAHPAAAPAQVSRTKIFFTAPGISVTPSLDASTVTK